MYEIRDIEGGDVLGTVQFRPFELEFTEAGRERGLAEAMDGIEEATVMDTAAPPQGNADDTAAEREVEPPANVVKERVGALLTARNLVAAPVE